MASTFMGLEIAKRGLSAHQRALQVTGHNISNADNEHYARQRVNFSAMTPLYEPSLNREMTPGMIGQGVELSSIERIRDHYIDDRIIETSQDKSFWEVKERYYREMEIFYNEPNGKGLSTSISQFWGSWQELSRTPEEYGNREIVKTRAEELAVNINNLFEKLQNLRGQADYELRVSVEKFNATAAEIRELNEKILKSEALGDEPNDLRDRRDQMLQELSNMANISVGRSDKDELMVYLGGEILIQGEIHNKLITVPDPKNEGYSKLLWAHNKKEVQVEQGTLSSLLEMRDVAIKENIDKIDELALNIAEVVNEIHRDGFGMTKETNIDFFSIDPLSKNIRGNFDLNNDGQDEVSAVFKMAGKNSLVPDRPIGVSGTLTFVRNDENHTPVQIAYRENETLEDVIQKINKSGAGVVAYMDHRDRLVIKGLVAEDDWQKNFMIRHVEDSGELLVGFAGLLQNSGPGGAYDYRRIDEVQKLQVGRENISFSPVFHAAGALELSAGIRQNIGRIAASSGRDTGGTGDINNPNGSKDGSIAIKIAQALNQNNTMVGTMNNALDYYNSIIAKLGVDGRAAIDKVESSKVIMKNLENMRQSVMGVNLDEEMSNMVQFQQGYNAAARVLQTMNEMLEFLINRLG